MKNFEQEVIVSKYGSTSVTNGEGMDHERLAGYAVDLAQAADAGINAYFVAAGTSLEAVLAGESGTHVVAS